MQNVSNANKPPKYGSNIGKLHEEGIVITAENVKSNGKFHTGTDHVSPDGQQRYRTTLSLSSTLDGSGASGDAVR